MVLTNINWQIEHATSRLVTPENQPVQGRGVPLVLARRPPVSGRQQTVTKCRLVICHGAAADVPPPRGRRATAPWQPFRRHFVTRTCLGVTISSLAQMALRHCYPVICLSHCSAPPFYSCFHHGMPTRSLQPRAETQQGGSRCDCLLAETGVCSAPLPCVAWRGGAEGAGRDGLSRACERRRQ